MNKRILKAAALITVIIFAVLSMTSCSPKYETITQHPGNYRYSLGENVEIVDIETGNEIAELVITSCRLVEDEPFIVVKRDSSDDEDDFEEDKYTALYELEYEFDDTNDYVNDVSLHFRSRDNNFDINPAELDEKNGVLYVAARKGNNGDDTVTLGFSYDTMQSRDTATFDIKLNETVKEKSFENCEIVVVGSNNDKSYNKKEQAEGKAGLWAIVALVFGIAIMLIMLAAPVLGIIGFANSVSNSKKLRLAYDKIRQLEYMLNNTTARADESNNDETHSEKG